MNPPNFKSMSDKSLDIFIKDYETTPQLTVLGKQWLSMAKTEKLERYKNNCIMKKKKGDICIINRDIFVTDDNYPQGFTIPVNTRLIIDNITNKYFQCTLDNGYKTSIDLDNDNSLIIITDNKKINKFKQQLAENMNIRTFNIDTCSDTDLNNIIKLLEDKRRTEGIVRDEIAYLQKLKIEKKRRLDIANPQVGEIGINKPNFNDVCAAPKTIIKRKVWTVETLEYSDGSSMMTRTNDGFTLLELRGLCELISDDLLQQFKGIIQPDIIKRNSIIDGD